MLLLPCRCGVSEALRPSTSVINMATSAKVLATRDVQRLLAHVCRGRFKERNSAMVRLSYFAGLRACEMAGLDWSMMAGAHGSVGQHMTVSGSIAKNGRERMMPLHPELKAALTTLHHAHGRPRTGPVIRSLRGGHMTPRSVVNWFAKVYAELGFEGCSSHSGRRTFITRSARLITKAGGSLRDVQELAGHSCISVTERYIVCDRDAQRKLMRLL